FFFTVDSLASEICPFSLHDALPIYWRNIHLACPISKVHLHISHIYACYFFFRFVVLVVLFGNRLNILCILPFSHSASFFFLFRIYWKSTRLNSIHVKNSYAVFCFKK